MIRKGEFVNLEINYIALVAAIAFFRASSLSGESFCSLLIVERSEAAELLR